MSAIISKCGKYRYVLTRNLPQLVRHIKPCLFIMLNPSTADATENDPTIRRCIGFAERELCTSLTVINLYAYRATKPKDLLIIDFPVGEENQKHWVEQFDKHRYGLIVAAWGSHKMARLHSRIFPRDYKVFCLGKNKDGMPKHPLFLSSNTKLEVFE